MAVSSITAVAFSFVFLFSTILAATPDAGVLLSCLKDAKIPPSSVSALLHAPNAPDYSSLLYLTMQNLRFNSSDTVKPSIIITPKTEAEISATIVCCKKNNFQIRIRSGGHDYEGLSYASSKNPFVILDLFNFKSIAIDTASSSAWVGAGATLGELYYGIAEKSKTLGFPAGLCSTVGAGGHISGGGTGTMSRKYGLASDHVTDAKIVDVNGRVLDRSAMGEDLFWAIRSGGGTSFGVIIAWRINLVPVPQNVTVFELKKTERSEVLLLLEKWQKTINNITDDLFIRAVLSRRTVSKKKTVGLKFSAMYLGPAADLIKLMNKDFPEMGLNITDCKEMSWIQSVVYFNRFPDGTPLSSLLDREYQDKRPLKTKCDIVNAPIPQNAWEGLMEKLLANGITAMMDPHGGKMSGVPENQFPFPHRVHTLYHIKYTASWEESEEEKAGIQNMRETYAYMAPFVSQNPRGSYINYRDLDVGMDESGNSTYEDSVTWGVKYFKGNYKRLALVKTWPVPGFGPGPGRNRRFRVSENQEP